MAVLNNIAPGRRIAERYEVVRLLGQGGMGAVYEARHVALEKPVALKVMALEDGTDAEAVARFLREARTAATIGHPNIVEVFDQGQDGELLFIAMERLEGEELAARIARQGPLEAGFVARVGADLADAVAAAHERGVVHRDLKPQNVFLARRGRHVDVVKVLDFGIAKLAGGDLALTRTGQIFGTPMYMSPEQMRDAKSTDARSDVYAIGAVLYEALAGRAPFEASTLPELALKIIMEEPPDLGALRPDAPAELVAAVRGAMAKDPAQRWQTARELGDALAAIAQAAGYGAAGPSVPPAAVRSVRPSAPPPTSAVAATVAAPADAAPRPGASGGRFLVLAGVVVGLAALGATAAVVVAHRPTPQAHPQATRPASRVLQFASAPDGAEVLDGDRLLCRTPCSAEVGPRVVALSARLAGYADATRAVPSPPANLVEFTLAPAAVPPPPPPSTPGVVLAPAPAAPPASSPRPRRHTGTAAPPPLLNR